MKYIYYLLGIVLLASSCSDDLLNTRPESSTTTDIIFADTKAATYAVNGLARMMKQQYLESQGWNGEGTIKMYYGNYTGNDFQKSNLSGWSNTVNSVYHERSTSTYVYFPWYYYYKLIVNANAIITKIDGASGTEEERQFIKAQALTYRAYAYFMLTQLYSYRWADSNNGASRSVPLRLDLSTGDIAASTLAQVYAQIYADLDQAISLYTSSGQNRASGDNYSPNINVAYAVYARAALTREDWTTAATYAPLARNGYALMTNAEYVDGGFNTPNSEWIWSTFDSSDETIYYYGFFAYIGSNSSASAARNYPAAISKELYDQIPATDVRRNMFLGPQAGETFDTSNGRIPAGAFYTRAKNTYGSKMASSSLLFAYMQFKFQSTNTISVGHFNHFRSAEMYLIEAEANCHIGGKDTETQALLTELIKTSGRDASYSTSNTGTALLDEVKLYRRIELWGEGFDWFDYKRWNEPIVRKTYANGGSFHTAFAITITPDEGNKWTWVFPSREIDYNDMIENVKE